MKTILVTTDFSKAADNACRYAIALAKDFKSTILLTHIFDVPALGYNGALTTMQLDYAALYDAAEKDLKTYYTKVSKNAPGVKIIPVLKAGVVASQIRDLAKEKKADLIVTGSKGKGFLESVLFGTNAWKILRNAPCMSLAVPYNAKYKGLKKIVYATDLLKDNIAHLKELIPVAKKAQSEIVFLNVNNKVFNDNDVKFNEAIRKIKKQFPYKKITGAVVADIEIASGISTFLSKHKANVLVMLPRKKSLFNRLFLEGSVTERMLYHTSVPVLVLHERDYTQRAKKSPAKTKRSRKSSSSKSIFK